ncbi:MAG: hypothetical protein ACK559_10850, partial [bacterium]
PERGPPQGAGLGAVAAEPLAVAVPAGGAGRLGAAVTPQLPFQRTSGAMRRSRTGWSPRRMRTVVPRSSAVS